MTAVVGIDLGGTGARVMIAPLAHPDRAETPVLRAAEHQVEPGAGDASEGLLAARISAALAIAAATRPELYQQVAVICIGATGMSMRVPDKDALAALIRDEYTRLRADGLGVGPASDRRVSGAFQSGGRQVAHRPGPWPGALRLVLATDSVTAHAAALSGAPGVVCALGTGAVALATDWQRHWRRADGWGHLLGDRGGGAWVATQALRAALRWHDVIPTELDGSALFAAARDRWGEPQRWPIQLAPGPGRAGELAAFVPAVVRVARAGDEAAQAILREAGRQAAHSTLAAARPPAAAEGAVVGRTGGMFRIREVAESFDVTIMDQLPRAQIVAADAEPVSGALHLARLAAGGQVAARAPYVWIRDVPAPG